MVQSAHPQMLHSACNEAFDQEIKTCEKAPQRTSHEQAALLIIRIVLIRNVRTVAPRLKVEFKEIGCLWLRKTLIDRDGLPSLLFILPHSKQNDGVFSCLITSKRRDTLSLLS